MKNRNTNKGTYYGITTYCPVDVYGDCPYCDKDCICHIEDPMSDCDDFGSIYEGWENWYEEVKDKDKDAIVIDENRFAEVKDKFIGLLEDLQVPTPTVEKCWDGYKFTWFFLGWDGDVIIHSGSYGHEVGWVESMNFPWDEGDVSSLPVEEMAWRIHQLFQGA